MRVCQFRHFGTGASIRRVPFFRLQPFQCPKAAADCQTLQRHRATPKNIQALYVTYTGPRASKAVPSCYIPHTAVCLPER